MEGFDAAFQDDQMRHAKRQARSAIGVAFIVMAVSGLVIGIVNTVEVNRTHEMRTLTELEGILPESTSLFDALHSTTMRSVMELMSSPEKNIASDQAYSVFLNRVATAANANSARILCILPDGTTIVDTGKQGNTRAHAIGKTINENHMSRVAFLAAMHSHEGYGAEQRYSTTMSKFQIAAAQRAGPFGLGGGACRVSRDA